MKLKSLLKPLALIAVCMLAAVFVLELPYLHKSWLRNKVADKVFEIRGKAEGGGGTGFQVTAPSGVSYIVTNSHICNYAEPEGGGKGTVLVIRGKHAIPRRVLEVSGEADLCLVEGWPNVEGLKIGGNVAIGDMVASVGHPLLGPTTMTVGEVRGFETIELPDHVMKSGDKKTDEELDAQDGACNLPKNIIRKEMLFFLGIIPLGEVTMCYVVERNAIDSNVTIFPGNSGSPLVDKYGQVVGVMFAADRRTNWGLAVNVANLKHFLADW